MKWPEVAALGKDTPVVIPIGALEQHGPHLPLYTDTLIVEEVARRASERLGDRVLFAPAQWLGNSHHHLDFSGTLSADPRTYLDLLAGLLENFVGHGFKRILILNGHGGNIVPARQATFEVRQRHRVRTDLLLLSAAYWALGARPVPLDARVEEPPMTHGGYWETSMVLRAAPHLVSDPRQVTPAPRVESFAPADRAWTMKDRSSHGHVGDPQHATAEQGEALFRVFTDDVVRLLDRMVAWDGASWS